MPALLEDPVDHLCALGGPDRPRVMIALAGLPGSGKSTYATWLATRVNQQLGQGAMVALGMDGFHLSKEMLRRLPNPEEAFARRGAPWTFDPAGLYDRLQQVRAGFRQAPVAWPGFQHDIGDPVEGAEVVPPAARIILVEGIYVLYGDSDWLPVSESFDERWYLDTPAELAMERLAQRHMRAWGFSRAEAQHRIDTSDGLNATLVAQSRSRAHWLIASENDPAS